MCFICFSVQKIAIYCNMNNPLRQFGNIPVTVSALESLFPNIKGRNQKK